MKVLRYSQLKWVTRPKTGAASAWLQGQGESDGKIITEVLTENMGFRSRVSPRR